MKKYTISGYSDWTNSDLSYGDAQDEAWVEWARSWISRGAFFFRFESKSDIPSRLLNNLSVYLDNF